MMIGDPRHFMVRHLYRDHLWSINEIAKELGVGIPLIKQIIEEMENNNE